jgi:hypothetical protein
MQDSAPPCFGDETKTTSLAAIPVVIATSTSGSAPLTTVIVAITLSIAPSTTVREPAPATLRHGTGDARCWTGQTATDSGRPPRSCGLKVQREGTEKAGLGDADFAFHQGEFQRLLAEMEAAAASSPLPAEVTGRDALNDLLLRLRGAGLVNDLLHLQ